MNYIGLNYCDSANGPGVRVSLFVSGCSLHCKGCFNPESWDFKAGKPFTEEVLNSIIQHLKSEYITGFSILGGDPMEKENQEEVLHIVERIKEEVPNKSIWLWTGRMMEHIWTSPILSYVDVLVDGPFIQKLKVKEQGKWFGSTNQRIINLKEIR